MLPKLLGISSETQKFHSRPRPWKERADGSGCHMEAWSSCDMQPTERVSFPEPGIRCWPVVQISAHCKSPPGAVTQSWQSTGIQLSPSPQFLNGAKDLQQQGQAKPKEASVPSGITDMPTEAFPLLHQRCSGTGSWEGPHVKISWMALSL